MLNFETALALVVSETVEPLLRNRNPKMTQNLHVFAICRPPELDNDVISGVTVDNVGVDVHITFSDSRSNRFRDIRRAAFVTYERTNERKLAYSNSAKRNGVSPKNRP